MNVIELNLGPLGTNCYIVYGDDGIAAVIDPADSGERIKSVLEERGLRLEAVLLTHAHFDHIMAIDEVRGNHSRLYVHRDDKRMLNDPYLNCMVQFSGKEKSFGEPDVELCDGDVITFGQTELRVMHTPGHSKGSVCYVGDGCIFSGDTLFRESIGRTDLYGGSFNSLKESLKKIAALEGDYRVYPGHGPSTTLDYEKNYNLYMNTLR